MKLSVIIPVYNCEKYLERCLDSVINQDMTDDELEIIIIDDGSTDSSREIADRYAARYLNIQVIHQSNQGVSAARNKGLDLAQGDYIHFVDSDDYILYANAYQALFAVMKKTVQPIDILRIDYVSFFENKSIKDREFVRLNHVKVTFEGTGKDLCRQKLFAGQMWCSLYRRDLIEQLHLRFDSHMIINEDALFNLQLYHCANHVVMTDAKIYAYFRNSGSVTFTIDEHRLKSVIDNMFDSLPTMKNVVHLYDDQWFRQFRIESIGESVAKRMIMAGLSLSQIRDYIKRGFQNGIFPIGKTIDGISVKGLNMLLYSPTIFWLISFPYRNIYMKWIKPLRVENG